MIFGLQMAFNPILSTSQVLNLFAFKCQFQKFRISKSEVISYNKRCYKNVEKKNVYFYLPSVIHFNLPGSQPATSQKDLPFLEMY
jgi:hypothetical protein